MSGQVDSALQVLARDEPPTATSVAECLASSRVVARLTRKPVDSGLPLVWRLLALSEIPFASRLPYTQAATARALWELATPEGFSYTGRVADIVPCYNAMLVTALCRLGHGDDPRVQAGVEWIRRYQAFGRGVLTAWPGEGITRHGGCLRATPCFIGVAKSTRALLAAQGPENAGRDAPLIDAGVEYLLEHRLYRRQTTGEPISAHILDVSFPETYHVTLLELLQTVDAAGKLDDPRVDDAIEYVQARRGEAGWTVTYAYAAPGYVAFDRRGRPSAWVTRELDRILAKRRSTESPRAAQRGATTP
ncbi:MAG: hypothetical protein KC593_21225 [Myxococcales bacterium]|nr:hypothetical protein [Myxococcales bacterium]MCB9626994.1 hypothetical protein [Sandaracinaceae bacterium]